jgi:type I site-specific restriction-modification system R (restriction) subunit
MAAKSAFEPGGSSPEAGEKDHPVLTGRQNVVVIADEAHRSQYGLNSKLNRDNGKVAYGFAKYLRDALPRASFIGFTGTPVEKDDINTRSVFGDYIDIYDFSRAVEDGVTVPIYYESRVARIQLDEDEKPKIDAEIAELTEDEAQSEQERLKRKWASVEALVGADKRLAMIAEDLVRHFEARTAALEGKGMIVCMSRRICVALYDAIIKLRPEWQSDDDEAGVIKVVMTGATSDPAGWQKHIGKRPKARRELLAKRAKDAGDPLKLVIVRDMWLTGFDAPCMHTMYVDKPMHGHGLMQAIARVNRVFRDKPAGLIVDYIGIAQSLKNALAQYSGPDQEQTGIDEEQAVAVMLEKHEIVCGMFHGFDYSAALAPDTTPQRRLSVMAQAIEWIAAECQDIAIKTFPRWGWRYFNQEERRDLEKEIEEELIARFPDLRGYVNVVYKRCGGIFDPRGRFIPIFKGATSRSRSLDYLLKQTLYKDGIEVARKSTTTLDAIAFDHSEIKQQKEASAVSDNRVLTRLRIIRYSNWQGLQNARERNPRIWNGRIIDRNGMPTLFVVHSARKGDITHNKSVRRALRKLLPDVVHFANVDRLGREYYESAERSFKALGIRVEYIEQDSEPDLHLRPARTKIDQQTKALTDDVCLVHKSAIDTSRVQAHLLDGLRRVKDHFLTTKRNLAVLGVDLAALTPKLIGRFGNAFSEIVQIAISSTQSFVFATPPP